MHVRESQQLKGELQKIKPLCFDGEKVGEEDEVWMLDFMKYLQLHDYSTNLDARIAIYNLQGKASTWWEWLKQVKQIDERQISWDEFSNYFKYKYLSEHYYQWDMQEFFKLKSGNMTMEEYEKKFLELLKYANFNKDEKVKIQCFLSGLEMFYREKITYEPQELQKRS